jgi:hypothetical protein
MLLNYLKLPELVPLPLEAGVPLLTTISPRQNSFLKQYVQGKRAIVYRSVSIEPQRLKSTSIPTALLFIKKRGVGHLATNCLCKDKKMKLLAVLMILAGNVSAQTYSVNGPHGLSTITVSPINGGCQWVQTGVGGGSVGSIQGPPGSL